MNNLAMIPLLPKKPYSPLHKAVMTIGVGFRYASGVMLCADQQVTVSEVALKYRETKILSKISENGDYCLAMAIADDPNLAKEVWEKLSRENLKPDIQDIEGAISAILDERGRQYVELPMQLLFGISTQNESRLFEFRGRGLNPVSEYSVIGTGNSSLIRYLLERLHSNFMSESEAFALGAYLLSRAEEYIEGVGGPLDLLAVKHGPCFHGDSGEVVTKIAEMVEHEEDKLWGNLLKISLPFPTEP